MTAPRLILLEPPRIEDRPARILAGMSARFSADAKDGIPVLWGNFVAHIETITNAVEGATYGVCSNVDAARAFDYMAAIEVTSVEGVPDTFTHMHLPAQRYAVFTHTENLSAIADVWYSLWQQMKPEAGLIPADGPSFERYDHRFDPATGSGGFEIWLPIQS